MCIRKRNHIGLHRESEGGIVPFEGERQQNYALGKSPCFVHATKEWRMRGIAEMRTTPENIRTLQRELYCKAKYDGVFTQAGLLRHKKAGYHFIVCMSCGEEHRKAVCVETACTV